ncbi:Cell wall assembly regulator [Agyrium rufum]|nr:Cell wall assembly regulator [Agyrium rufum]
MTSYDRHASHDSPYRTGQHMPLNQSRHAPLTSIATSAMDSHQDLNAPYGDENQRTSSASNLRNGYPGSPGLIQSPGSPYSPGMRSMNLARINSGGDNKDPFESIGPGEIQMQNFEEGLPPPPPVSHSWKRISRWVEDNYEELWDQLSEGCTQNDINELEHELDCSLPLEVRESLQTHDGQEPGGRPTGIIFGCMLLDCEEIVHEWKNWRKVNEEYLSEPIHGMNNHHINLPSKSFGAGPSTSSLHGSTHSTASSSANPLWRQELLAKQTSVPPKAVQSTYAHPAWIPLARDWGGNNIAVDLAPGPSGKWGQIIIFGRDFDVKYVVARSWSAFLAMVADDMGSEKVFVDEETQELKLREFRQASVEPPYMDVLRWRMDQKYGRRPPPNHHQGGNHSSRSMNGNAGGKRKSTSAGGGPNGLGVNTRAANLRQQMAEGSGSPYSNPIDGPEGNRGRSPQRFTGLGPAAIMTPRTATLQTGNGMGLNRVSSPLSQVSEETVKARDFAQERLVGGGRPGSEGSATALGNTAASSATTGTGRGERGAVNGVLGSKVREEDLVEVATPTTGRGPEAEEEEGLLGGHKGGAESNAIGGNEDEDEDVDASGMDLPGLKTGDDGEGEMKNVGI